MRVLMISKACVVGIYQRKLEEIARRGVELLALVPPSWKDERGEMRLERAYTDGYRLEVLPIHLNGNFHVHYYTGIGDYMRRFRPDVVHIDEEPYNLAAWQALRHTQRIGAKSVLFSWQNLVRHYPPPFSWGERWALRHTDALIAGTESAADVWREKGYHGALPVIPQFGVDPDIFRPCEDKTNGRPFTIGYFGRLVEEKGVEMLLEAVARLGGDWRLVLLGGGPLREQLHEQAAGLGIGERVQFRQQIPSTEMPRQYHDVDALVLPSLTRPNWKEQFGRVLVEAMSSGIPVIGSDSGAIPGVIGDGGLIFTEGDANALTECLAMLQSDATRRAELARKGRARVLAHFTHAQVAAETVEVYEKVLDG